MSAMEISSGRWEGEPILGKSQEQCFWALREIRNRSPFVWQGLDCDNGQEFINDILYKHCAREKADFTRSRPGHKNDNAYIKEKNRPHVRRVLGCLRYDTSAEAVIIRDLYRNKLGLYKNFSQPVMKLMSKERIESRIKRKCGTPLTPHQRLIDSRQPSTQAEQRLAQTYLSLNPAALKRAIDAKVNCLLTPYQTKNRTSRAEHYESWSPIL